MDTYTPVNDPRLPALRVPSEVLAHIFGFLREEMPLGYDLEEEDQESLFDFSQANVNYQSSDSEASDSTVPSLEIVTDSYVPDRLGWTRVAHVCEYWRDVAMHNPSLWGKFILDFPQDVIEEIPRRSKAASLDLTVPLWYDPVVVQSVFATDLHCIRALVFESLSSHTACQLSAPAPRLEELEVISRRVGGYSIPSPFLQDQASRLTRLDVRDPSHIPWNSPVLSNLTHLTI
ncbi:hypothetical protein OF83DRAFT_1160644, partial [Amylostereum chailletii]